MQANTQHATERKNGSSAGYKTIQGPLYVGSCHDNTEGGPVGATPTRGQWPCSGRHPVLPLCSEPWLFAPPPPAASGPDCLKRVFLGKMRKKTTEHQTDIPVTSKKEGGGGGCPPTPEGGASLLRETLLRPPDPHRQTSSHTQILATKSPHFCPLHQSTGSRWSGNPPQTASDAP